MVSAMTESSEGPIHLVIGVALAFLAIVARGNSDVALLFWGTAAAFVTRWWIFDRPLAETTEAR